MDADLRDRWLEHAHQTVAAAGRHSGAARTAIIEKLATDGQCLISTQELADRLRAAGRSSIATTYRVMDELRDLGLVHQLNGPDGIARYEIADPRGRHHHHAIDETTGAVTSFTDPDLDRAIHEAAQRLGLEITSHDVILRGNPEASARADGTGTR